MDGYEQNLHIADNVFDGMRYDTDRVLQRLLKNMVEKGSLEGSVTIKIDVNFSREFIQNTDPQIDGETRQVLIPAFTHKIGSVMQIKDEAKGGTKYEGMEIAWDDEKKEYVVRPIANTTQRSIFDADFTETLSPEPEDEESGQPALEGRRVAALPGPTGESGESDDEAADVSEEMFEDGEDEEGTPIIDDEYGYEENGEEF